VTAILNERYTSRSARQGRLLGKAGGKEEGYAAASGRGVLIALKNGSLKVLNSELFESFNSAADK
jgi:hypothetical protein